MKCYNCLSSNNVFYAAENGYTLVKCSDCGLLYVSEPPSSEEITAAAKQGLHHGETELDVTGAFDAPKVGMYVSILCNLFGDTRPIGKQWLDVGCGHGEFMLALKDFTGNRISVAGSEPNEKKQRSARSRGLEVDFIDLSKVTEKYDFISLLNVYSHLPNPPEFISQLKKLLLPGGELIIQTGDAASLLPEEMPRPLSLPDHLSFASESILTNILRSSGFEIVLVKKYPYMKLGPVRVAKELMKFVLPKYRSNLVSLFVNNKKWKERDMYIRAGLVTVPLEPSKP